MKDVLRQDKLRQFLTLDHFPGSCVKMDITKPGNEKISHGTEMWERRFPMAEQCGKGEDFPWKRDEGKEISYGRAM